MVREGGTTGPSPSGCSRRVTPVNKMHFVWARPLLPSSSNPLRRSPAQHPQLLSPSAGERSVKAPCCAPHTTKVGIRKLFPYIRAPALPFYLFLFFFLKVGALLLHGWPRTGPQCSPKAPCSENRAGPSHQTCTGGVTWLMQLQTRPLGLSLGYFIHCYCPMGTTCSSAAKPQGTKKSPGQGKQGFKQQGLLPSVLSKESEKRRD